MKIEVDLTEIFEDEDGRCISVSMKERIEAAIVARAEKVVTEMIREKFKNEIDKQITDVVKSTLVTITENMLDEMYVPTTRYGERDDPITLRTRICRDIESAMRWSDRSSYSNSDSLYVKIIKETVSDKLKEFANEFTKTIDEQFITACMEFAVEKLKHRTKVKD